MTFPLTAIPAGASVIAGLQDQQNKKMALTKNQQTVQDLFGAHSVSYTHLTLPTKRIV